MAIMRKLTRQSFSYYLQMTVKSARLHASHTVQYSRHKATGCGWPLTQTRLTRIFRNTAALEYMTQPALKLGRLPSRVCQRRSHSRTPYRQYHLADPVAGYRQYQ